MIGSFLDKRPDLLDEWSRLNPLGRIGRPDELRGVVTWLASDASTFCIIYEPAALLSMVDIARGRYVLSAGVTEMEEAARYCG